MDYFECAAPAGDGRCSDNACPCPEVEIPRGQGYLFISQELVDFRRQYPGEEEAGAAMEARLQGAGFSGGFYSISPVLVCEQGAKLRNLDLKTAAADAAHWWATGKVALRATPSAGSQASAAETRIESAQASAPATTALDQAPSGPDAKECQQPGSDLRDAIEEGRRLAQGQQWDKAISLIEKAFVSTDADLDAEIDSSLRNLLTRCFRMRANSLLHAAMSDANKPLPILKRSLKNGRIPIPQQVILPGGRRGSCCMSCGGVVEGQYPIGREVLLLCSTCSQQLETEKAGRASTLRDAFNTANECLVHANALDPADGETMAALAEIRLASDQVGIQLVPVVMRPVVYSDDAGTLWSGGNTCWRCGQALSQEKQNIASDSFTMQKVLSKRELGKRVLTKCSCGRIVAHLCRNCVPPEPSFAAALGGAAVGLLAGIGACFVVRQYHVAWFIAAVLAGFLSGLVIDFVRDMCRKYPDIKQSPIVANLVAEGWQLPENAG
ncbi:MAG: hypothetical protein GXY83_17375 [Rhodopirellula sp.]|nr:hypothetical protein [Rhodopirellula sp.]